MTVTWSSHNHHMLITQTHQLRLPQNALMPHLQGGVGVSWQTPPHTSSEAASWRWSCGRVEAQSWAQSGPAPNITGRTGSSSEAHPQPCQTPGMGGRSGGERLVDFQDCIVCRSTHTVYKKHTHTDRHTDAVTHTHIHTHTHTHTHAHAHAHAHAHTHTHTHTHAHTHTHTHSTYQNDGPPKCLLWGYADLMNQLVTQTWKCLWC